MTIGLVRIRLARFGRTNNPIYNIVVTNSHKSRDGKPIEVLGVYNPIPTPVVGKGKKTASELLMQTKDIKLDFDRTKYWLGVGAQPTEIVIKLLKKCGILGEEWGKKFESSRKVIVPRREVLE